MGGFLTSLAGLALGVAPPGAARLSLPPRFATVRDPPWMPASPEGNAAVGAAPVGRTVESVFRAPVEARQPVREPPPAARPPARLEPEAPRPKRPETVVEPPAARAADAMELPDRHSPAEPVGPGPVTSGRGRSDIRVGPEVRASSVSAARELPPRRLAEIGTTVPMGPLSAAAVASRATVEPDTRPIVHVTIDRIDVRAPRDAAKPESAPKRAKAQPEVSLADYLRVRP